jgi:hypothetical protein
MAIKTFTTGEVLTAADTNTYLANSGLVFVKSQTIGAGVSSVTVSDAFSATYDNYKILVNDFVTSAGTQFSLTLAGITTLYQYQLNYGSYSGTPSSIGGSSAGQWQYVTGTSSGTKNSSDINLYAPFLVSPKRITALYIDAGAGGQMFGFNSNTASASAFTLSLASGTMTGGTISVYGYRKG